MSRISLGRAGFFAVLGFFGLAMMVALGTPSGRAFPGANGDLVIESSRDGDYEIWRIDSDGGNPTKLTTTTAQNYEPAWSPDGTRIAFTSERDVDDQSTDIWMMNAYGTDQTRLTMGADQDSAPAWTADGSKIAFRRSSTPPSQIMIVSAGGGTPVTLIDLPGTNDEAAFSPDGTKVAFANRVIDGDFEIWVADADGSNPVQLTDNDRLDRAPAWSPDSAHIAYTCENANEDRDVCVIDPNGANFSVLKGDSANDELPSWSPDGLLIAFTSNHGSGDEVDTMEPNGGNVQQVSVLGDANPDWQALHDTTHIQGNINCDGVITEADFDLLINFAAGLYNGVSPTPGCPALAGQDTDPQYAWGDLNCDGLVDALDSLYLLAHLAGITLPPVGVGCTPIGEEILV